MLNTTHDNFDTDVVQASHLEPVVVMLHAAWCGPCKAMKPALEQLAAEQGFKLVGVDAGADREMAAKLGVRAVPALIVFDQGAAQHTRAGGAAPEQLRMWLAAAGVPVKIEVGP